MDSTIIDIRNPQYRGDVQTLTRLLNSLPATLAILRKAPPSVRTAWLAKDERLQLMLDLAEHLSPYISLATQRSGAMRGVKP